MQLSFRACQNRRASPARHFAISGSLVVVAGEVDEEADAAVDWAAVQGSKPSPITYGVL